MITEYRESGDSQFLKLPYRASIGSGSPNNGYFDLLARPSDISRLKELNDYPELKALILFLISPQSHFVSLRIDTNKDAYILGPLHRSVGSMVTIAFRNPDPEDAIYFEDLARYLFDSGAKKGVGDQIRILCTLTTFSYVSRGLERGHCLDVY